MNSLMINFLSSKGKLKAYPCGIDVKESKKMLSELPELRDVLCVPTKSKLRTTLAKGTVSAKRRTAERA